MISSIFHLFRTHKHRDSLLRAVLRDLLDEHRSSPVDVRSVDRFTVLYRALMWMKEG